MGVVTRHGLRLANALAIAPRAMLPRVPKPSYGWSKPVSLTHHTINLPASGRGWDKRRELSRQNPRPGTAIRRHASATIFSENLKSP